ncbi:branched-chain amino acid ABC transporter permease [Shimia biformata]|uniref:branched-chain amino acid ABC transporter permease n=1 Tax=Shimia biformata TaxID=1294299 RepID=UPI001950D53A|nr:branched-chain amino acid ABC transporter permease [Shimia biformata]
MTDTATPDFATLSPSRGQKFRQRVLPLIALALILALVPALSPSRTVYSLLNAVGINIVFALSYNMLLGRGGLLSFGHAVYFGLGGYAAMHAMRAIEAGDGLWSGFPVFGLPVVGFAAGALAGAVIGWPSCRRAGTAFAMISLGVAELIAAAGFMFASIFGGEEGVTGDRMNGPELFGLSLGPVSEVYLFIAFWTVVGTAMIFAFTRTPLGKLSEATRDNPERVQFIGFDPVRIRYMVFIAAGAFAGLSGGMAAVNYEIFTPESLSLHPSGFVLLMAYIGGIRYFSGPILGAVVLTVMQSMLSDFTEAWLLYLGVLFIAIIMFAPGGLAGIFHGVAGTVRRDGAGRAARSLGLKAAGVSLLLVGLIVLIEVVIRWSNGYGEVFEPFGLMLETGSVLTWVLVAGPILGGAALVRFVAKTDEGGA